MKYKITFKGASGNEDRVVDTANVIVTDTMTKLTTGYGQGEIVHIMVPNDRVISVERVG